MTRPSKSDYEIIPSTSAGEDNMKTRGLGKDGSKRSTPTQICLALIINFSSLAPSLVLGFSAVLIPTLTAKENPQRMNVAEISWITSVPSITTPIGCLVAGTVSDKWGRRIALQVTNLICCFGWIIIAAAYYLSDYQYSLLIIGRLITGLTTGLALTTPAIYSAEIASPKLRATLTTWNGIAFSIGILISYVFGLIFKSDWGSMSTITAVLPCISTILIVLYLPESPMWLVAQNKLEEAQISIAKFYGCKVTDVEVKAEVDTLVTSQQCSIVKISQSGNTSLVSRLTKRSCIRPMALILTYFFFLQFSGAFVIISYAIDFVEDLKITIDPYYTIVAIAMTRLAASVTLGFISRKFGRRPLSIYSSLGMTIVMLSLGIYLLLVTKNNLTQTDLTKLSWIPALLLTVYFYVSTVGFLTIPYAMAAEIFPVDVRGITNGISICVGCIFNFIALKIYPSLLLLCGEFNLLFMYGVTSLLGTIFVYAFLPETKDKTLEEIEKYFENS